MRVAKDLAIWREIGEAYVQQWTVGADDDDDDKELDGPVVSALRRAIAEVNQRWSVIGWMSKNLL
jgi:hypothetical protein